MDLITKMLWKKLTPSTGFFRVYQGFLTKFLKYVLENMLYFLSKYLDAVLDLDEKF